MAKGRGTDGRLVPDGAPKRLRPGDVLAVKLDDGRYGLARVLDRRGRGYLVEALEGIHPAPPDLAAVGELVRLRRYAFGRGGEPRVLEVVDDPPDPALVVGAVPPSNAERSEQPGVVGDWHSVASSILGEWRWGNDREAYAREIRERREAAFRRYWGEDGE